MNDGGGPKPPVTKPTDLRQRAILLIDDDDLIAGSLRHQLTTEGWLVDVAVDGASVDAAMGTRRYDIVLVDPYLTGGVDPGSASILGSISRRQPDASLIVLTGYDSAQLERSLAPFSPLLMLRKPQSIQTLTKMISAFSERGAEATTASKRNPIQAAQE